MRCHSLLATLVLLILAPCAALASFDDEMNKMFGSMVNVTSPTGYMDQSRGVLSGGHVVVKNPIVSAQLLGFDPPTIDAGCGGIDMYGGSFSFISKDEIVQLMRSIGANAVGYAFKLGLTSLCPSCAATLEDLRKTIQQLNAFASDSCSAAKKIVDTIGIKSPFQIGGALEKSWFAGNVVKEGSLSDWFEANLNSFGSDRSNAQQTSTENQKIMGNIAWKVIATASENARKMTDWFEHGDEPLVNVIMSLTGTMIITTDDVAGLGGPDPKAQVRVDPYPPKITLQDLLGGEDSPNRVEVELYRCSDASGKCLNMTVETTEIETMSGKVRRLLLGDDSGNDGIVGKFATNAGSLSLEETQFLESIPLHGRRLRDLAISSRTAATIYAKKAADAIALELASNLIYEVIDAVKYAAALNPDPNATTYLGMVKEVSRDIEQEEMRIAQGFTTGATLNDLFASLQTETRRINWAVMQQITEKWGAAKGDSNM